jgi:hypothetical protein
LVKVLACCVCHTDLHAANGDWPAKPKLPFVPGHEVAGVVAALGSYPRKASTTAPPCARSLRPGRALLKEEPVIALGHRVVHGGLDYAAPVRVTETVLDDLAKLEPLAPLHQPHNLAPIRAIMKAAPQIPQIACFDAAFHRSQSNLAQTFALPRRFREEGVRRYGFHGPLLRVPRVAPEGARAGASRRADRLRSPRQRREPLRGEGRPQRRFDHGIHGC